MSAAVLEIQDAEIRFKRSSGEMHVEPGLASIDRHKTVVGIPARRVARLRPRELHNQFWSDLNLEPVPGLGPPTRTTADLAFAQLSSLWQTVGGGARDVVLTVPPQLSQHELGLLLGIAQECSIPVLGLVATPLLAVSQPEPGRTRIVLDADLHEVVATRIDQEGGASVAGFDVRRGAGLLAFEERWVQQVAKAFLTQTRFDPLHQGATEQNLYDQLPGWMHALGTEGRVDCVLRVGNQAYACNVARSEFVAAGQPLCDQIADLVCRAGEPPLSLLVSHRLAAIPGLAETLQRIPEVRVTSLEASAVLDHALLRIEELRSPSDGIVLTTRLAWRDAPRAPAVRSADAPRAPAVRSAKRAQGGRAPTHVVLQGLAHPIGPAPFTVGSDRKANLTLPADHRGVASSHLVLVRRGEALCLEIGSDAGVLLNGQPAHPYDPLEMGDCLELGEPPIQLLLVATVGIDGA